MKITLLLMLILTMNTKGQPKIFVFDQELTYDYHNKDSVTRRIIYLINSTDNSYRLRVTRVKKKYSLDFLDKNDILYRTKIRDVDFEKETIIAECEKVKRYFNPFKYQTENYFFTKSKDTLITKLT